MGKNAQSQIVLNREFSSGGVVFKGDEWLVTRSAASKLYTETYWRLPKGWIDNITPEIPGPMASGKIKADEESLQKSALREVMEEGGVEAAIVKKIGTVKYFYRLPSRPSSAYTAPDKGLPAGRQGRILKFVTFYLMEWKKDLPEGFDAETSEIAWL
ncbi:MAG: NUDIX domain-containing protein, partial [Candidatus Woesebacteria bacterium]|nr:NUDIX domain-containing protein [Candidatus Woesebacteria bacterium]